MIARRLCRPSPRSSIATRLPFGPIVGTAMSRSPTTPAEHKPSPRGTYRTAVGRPPRDAPVYGAPARGRYWATNLKGRSAAHAHHPPHRGCAAPPAGRRVRLQPSRARRLVAPPFTPGCSAPGADRSRGTLVASRVHPGRHGGLRLRGRPLHGAAPAAAAAPRRSASPRPAGRSTPWLGDESSRCRRCREGESPAGAMRMTVPRLGCRVVRGPPWWAAATVAHAAFAPVAPRPGQLRDQRLVAR